MSELRHLSVVNGYQKLVAAIRERKEAMGLSDKEIEHLAGLTAGHWSKLMAQTKSLGPVSLGRVLRALGLELIVSENVEKTQQIRLSYIPRDETQVRNPTMHTAAVHVRLTRRFLKRIGVAGGSNSRKNMSRRRARQIGKAAARARWDKVKSEPRPAQSRNLSI